MQVLTCNILNPVGLSRLFLCLTARMYNKKVTCIFETQRGTVISSTFQMMSLKTRYTIELVKALRCFI